MLLLKQQQRLIGRQFFRSQKDQKQKCGQFMVKRTKKQKRNRQIVIAIAIITVILTGVLAVSLVTDTEIYSQRSGFLGLFGLGDEY